MISSGFMQIMGHVSQCLLRIESCANLGSTYTSKLCTEQCLAANCNAVLCAKSMWQDALWVAQLIPAAMCTVLNGFPTFRC